MTSKNISPTFLHSGTRSIDVIAEQNSNHNSLCVAFAMSILESYQYWTARILGKLSWWQHSSMIFTYHAVYFFVFTVAIINGFLCRQMQLTISTITWFHFSTYWYHKLDKSLITAVSRYPTHFVTPFVVMQFSISRKPCGQLFRVHYFPTRDSSILLFFCTCVNPDRVVSVETTGSQISIVRI